MAIFPDIDGSIKTAPGVDIHAWTASAMESVDVVPLAMADLSLDGGAGGKQKQPAAAAKPKIKAIPLPYRYPTTLSTRVKNLQKDEPTRPGSRHRRRWENANLADVPNVQPPQPMDFFIRPSHPVRNVPYHLASLWDQRLREQAEDVAARRHRAQKRSDRARGAAPGAGRGEVPRDLRDAIKRSSTTGAWVSALEEIVRTYLARQAEGWEHVDGDSDSDGMDGGVVDDEDEMVVVVADGKVHGSRSVDGKLVFDDLGDGEAGTYRRWLAHAIADYYGLASRSLTVGKGVRSRRVVQISSEGRALMPPSPVLPPVPMRSSTGSLSAAAAAVLPRPLAEICCARA